MLATSFFRASFFALTICHSHALCYFPDGKTVASGYSPCGNTSGNSTCCQRGYACMSNKLCELTRYALDGPGQSTFVRGSCTDPSWNDPLCPSFCISPENKDTWSGAMGLNQCPGSSLDEYYCIDAATEPLGPEQACSIYPVVFQGTPTTVTIIGITTSFSLSSSTSSASSTPSRSTSPVVSSPSSQPQPISTSSSSLQLARPTRLPSSDSDSHGTAIGAGVGVPLGVAAIGVIALLTWKLRRSNNQSRFTSHDHSQLSLQALGQPTNPQREADNLPGQTGTRSAEFTWLKLDTTTGGQGDYRQANEVMSELPAMGELHELPAR